MGIAVPLLKPAEVDDARRRWDGTIADRAGLAQAKIDNNRFFQRLDVSGWAGPAPAAAERTRNMEPPKQLSGAGLFNDHAPIDANDYPRSFQGAAGANRGRIA